jgi:multiple sugar transport system substrate-binding protein
MRKLMFAVSMLVATSMLLAACGSTTQTPATPTTGAPAPKVQIRWLVGTGTDTEPIEAAIADFNASQDRIELSLALPTEGADMVGPIGWAGSNLFQGQYLDLTGLIASSGFDTSIFNQGLLKLDQTEEGQMGLPFAIAPAAVYYVPAMFDAAGLNYPPAEFGKPYLMPDGSERPWDWNTLADVARLLTLDDEHRNATEEGFDRARIVQFGFVPQWEDIVTLAGFWGDGMPGYYASSNLEVHIPVEAKQAWTWYYDGMWGAQPFIPTGAQANSAELGSGNTFNSGKVAMAVTHSWYTCCLIDFAAAGNEFQLAALPASPNDGRVYDHVQVDSFHIFKDSPHPNEALEVITYLITAGNLARDLDALPAIEGQQAAFFEARSAQYPFVTSWQPFMDGLADAHILPAGGYMPNFNDAWGRLMTFADNLQTTEGLDLAAEILALEEDLTVIVQK